ncbi:hypothetical protein Angca_006353, partial [Angiostrongylus cantonensis]
IDEIYRKLQQQRPTLLNRKKPLLHHDNARPHIAEPALRKLEELVYETLPHQPCSPDLSPTEQHFVECLEKFL